MSDNTQNSEDKTIRARPEDYQREQFEQASLFDNNNNEDEVISLASAPAPATARPGQPPVTAANQHKNTYYSKPTQTSHQAPAQPAPAPASGLPRLVLLDGMNLIMRAYHATATLKKTSRKGEQIAAVPTAISMVLSVLEHQQPTSAVMVFEGKGSKDWRKSLLASYKITRPALAPEILPQIEYIKDVLVALGVGVTEEAGLEADDLMAFLAIKAARDMGYEVGIVSSDRDMFQIVNDQPPVYILVPGAAPKMRFNEFTRYDTKAVREKFGVKPGLIPDYKALAGDPSDNIPGVPGLGPVAAQKLLNHSGTLERLLAEASKTANQISDPSFFTPKIRSLLRQHAEQALIYKRLACVFPMKDEPGWSERIKAIRMDFNPLKGQPASQDARGRVTSYQPGPGFDREGLLRLCSDLQLPIFNRASQILTGPAASTQPGR